MIYNLTGFTFYTIYNWAGHFLNDPKEKINGIDINDLVFSLWAWCMTVITLIQCFLIYPVKNLCTLLFILNALNNGTHPNNSL